MAAQRLGSILSDVTGTAKQVLRVKEDESGFEFVTPPTLSTYTVSNSSTDRTFNATDITLDELANVLSTLIKDVQKIYEGSGSSWIEVASLSDTNPSGWPTSPTAKQIAHGLGRVPTQCLLYILSNDESQLLGPYVIEDAYYAGNWTGYHVNVTSMYMDSTYVYFNRGFIDILGANESFKWKLYVK